MEALGPKKWGEMGREKSRGENGGMGERGIENYLQQRKYGHMHAVKENYITSSYACSTLY